MVLVVCFFKLKTAYDVRISDWSSDVCSSDLALAAARAWEVQALEAESREAGAKDALSDEDAAIALGFLLEDEADAEDADDRLEDDDTTRQSAVSSHIKNEEKPA